MPNTYDGIKNPVPAVKLESAPEVRVFQDGGGMAVPLTSSMEKDTAFGVQVTCGSGGGATPAPTNAFSQYWS
ncbi:MAG: hypothetical protein H7836_10395 [Magnetococcus sp. YQC-3]